MKHGEIEEILKDPFSSFFLLRGLPRTGKSTFARKYTEKNKRRAIYIDCSLLCGKRDLLQQIDKEWCEKEDSKCVVVFLDHAEYLNGNTIKTVSIFDEITGKDVCVVLVSTKQKAFFIEWAWKDVFVLFFSSPTKEDVLMRVKPTGKEERVFVEALFGLFWKEVVSYEGMCAVIEAARPVYFQGEADSVHSRTTKVKRQYSSIMKAYLDGADPCGESVVADLTLVEKYIVMAGVICAGNSSRRLVSLFTKKKVMPTKGGDKARRRFQVDVLMGVFHQVAHLDVSEYLLHSAVGRLIEKGIFREYGEGKRAAPRHFSLCIAPQEIREIEGELRFSTSPFM
ncbi:MAG: uncharacterized protein A8A55_1044 [Amphiamblys sp. WSBS2006]|nr:MAG: uncharacterized protein A8A55_1044 [Amphiamblys sp. WSBS2006]